MSSHGHQSKAQATPVSHTHLDFLRLQGFQAQYHIILGVVVAPSSMPPLRATHHHTPFSRRLSRPFILPVPL